MAAAGARLAMERPENQDRPGMPALKQRHRFLPSLKALNTEVAAVPAEQGARAAMHSPALDAVAGPAAMAVVAAVLELPRRIPIQRTWQ